jgi:hypothetical protein
MMKGSHASNKLQDSVGTADGAWGTEKFGATRFEAGFAVADDGDAPAGAFALPAEEGASPDEPRTSSSKVWPRRSSETSSSQAAGLGAALLVVIVASNLDTLQYADGVLGEHGGREIGREQIGGDRVVPDSHEANGQAGAVLAL